MRIWRPKSACFDLRILRQLETADRISKVISRIEKTASRGGICCTFVYLWTSQGGTEVWEVSKCADLYLYLH
jgi:hypothetical protein